MHYAYPGRKSSHPPTYATTPSPSSLISSLRRTRKRSLAIIVGAVIFFIILLVRVLGTSSDGVQPIFTKAPAGHPNVVIVTTINNQRDPSFNDAIRRNRDNYASKHGYATFFPNTNDYPISDAPQSWAKVPAIRHVMTKWPKTPFFFYIDERTVITNPSLSVEQHITDKARMEELMIGDIPVVPPDSVIRTFGHLKGDRIDLILTQDKEGLSQGSWIVRRGEWAKFLMDAWFDPLYRSYNFQKAERHALEHIVQWHGTLLAKIALIPQNIMASYTEKDAKLVGKDGLWKEGDFMVNFPECDDPKRNCKEEMEPWLKKSELQKPPA